MFALVLAHIYWCSLCWSPPQCVRIAWSSLVLLMSTHCRRSAPCNWDLASLFSWSTHVWFFRLLQSTRRHTVMACLISISDHPISTSLQGRDICRAIRVNEKMACWGQCWKEGHLRFWSSRVLTRTAGCHSLALPSTSGKFHYSPPLGLIDCAEGSARDGRLLLPKTSLFLRQSWPLLHLVSLSPLSVGLSNN